MHWKLDRYLKTDDKYSFLIFRSKMVYFDKKSIFKKVGIKENFVVLDRGPAKQSAAVVAAAIPDLGGWSVGGDWDGA